MSYMAPKTWLLSWPGRYSQKLPQFWSPIHCPRAIAASSIQVSIHLGWYAHPGGHILSRFYQNHCYEHILSIRVGQGAAFIIGQSSFVPFSLCLSCIRHLIYLIHLIWALEETLMMPFWWYSSYRAPCLGDATSFHLGSIWHFNSSASSSCLASAMRIVETITWYDNLGSLLVTHVCHLSWSSMFGVPGMTNFEMSW